MVSCGGKTSFCWYTLTFAASAACLRLMSAMIPRITMTMNASPSTPPAMAYGMIPVDMVLVSPSSPTTTAGVSVVVSVDAVVVANVECGDTDTPVGAAVGVL